VPLLIRGDITFLRQDFSVQLPVPGLAPQPGAPANLVALRQRWDYVTRARYLTPTENQRIKDQVTDPTAYPQRESVLFALRELTGKDVGQSTEEWRALYPNAEADVEAARLGERLVKADRLDLPHLLAQYRDAKGAVYTQALANAVRALSGERKDMAREALASRLARMTSTTLRDKLAEDDPEVRRAAALAAARKEDRTLVPDLIELLDDGNDRVAQAARASLKAVAGQDYPDPSAWRAWWFERREP
jgi:hypothetical protein